MAEGPSLGNAGETKTAPGSFAEPGAGFLGRFPVTDLNVQEPEIEDVIRQLFAAAP